MRLKITITGLILISWILRNPLPAAASEESLNVVPPDQEISKVEKFCRTKADFRFCRSYREAKEEGRKEEWLDCIIKTKEWPTEKELKKLRGIGFKYRTVAGNILTGKIQVRKIKKLLKTDFVEYIEGRVPLGIKKKVQ